VAYYNMDMQNLDIEIGFPVPEKLEGQGAVRASRIPGGRLAACTYTGPYQDMAPAYDALARMVREQGLKATGVAYEIYLNDPQTTPPGELQTRILFPLKG
jgi:effector-binding domain-containing protein